MMYPSGMTSMTLNKGQYAILFSAMVVASVAVNFNISSAVVSLQPYDGEEYLVNNGKEEGYSQIINPPLIQNNSYLSEHNVVFTTKRLERLKKLQQISSLPDDWNMNGAMAFSKPLIEKVRLLILKLDALPEVFPTAEGAIQLEYDKPDKSHLEIEVFEDNAEVYTVSAEGKETFYNISPALDSINEVVARFYE